MAREIINVGATPNDGQGDPIRTAFIKTNNNFGELYSRVQVDPPVALTGSVGDTAGMTAYNEEYYYYCFANYDGSSVIWRQVPNAAQANITALSATGNITADYYFGDGGFLSNVIAGAGTELVNGNTNITLANGGNANISIGGTANVAVFTSTGVAVLGNITAGTLSTTGNVSSGNLRTTGTISATGNIFSASSLQTAGDVSASGNVLSGNLVTSGNVQAGNLRSTGSLSVTGNIFSAATVRTVGNVSAAGNVTGNYIIGDGGFLSNVTVASNVAVTQIANGTTSMAVTGSAGNIAVTIAGVPNVVQFVPLGIQVAGNVNTANVYNTGKYVGVGNVTGSNLLATSNVIATGKVQGTYVNADLTMSATGNITTAAYFFGDGRYITNLDLIYGNSNVAAFLGSFGSNTINTTGDISAGNLVINRISSDDSTSIIISDDLEVNGDIKGYSLEVESISSGSSTFIFVNDGLEVHGDILTEDILASGNVNGGNLTTAGSLNIGGNIIGNLLPDANISYNLGSTTQRWKDLWLSNSTIYLGNSTIGANATSIIITNPAGGQTVLSGASGASEVTGAIVSVTGNVTGGNILSTGIVSTSGNVTGGNILSTGIVSTSGNVTGGNINSGNITITGDLISSLGTTLTIDPATSGSAGLVIINGNLQVNGTTTTINSNVVSTNDLTINFANNAINSAAANGGGIEVGPIGSPFITWLYNNTANSWTSSGGISAVGNVTATYFTGTATQALYADIAENYTADASYEPGTVLEFGGNKEVTVAADETTRIAGIVSTQPAHLMNSMLTGEHVVAVALLGRVPCRVRGNIAKGDMLISAGDGYARAKQTPMMGTVIGKALEASTGDHGIIEVVVGRL